jgi:CubicO group peptidase (beta-lactamase class C family)
MLPYLAGVMTKGRTEPERETSMTGFRILATTLCLSASGAALAEDPLPRANPEEVRKTIDYMLSDQLGENIKNLIGNADPTRADYGFGLGVAVRTTPGVVRMMGPVGQFSWPGASGTEWWADPKEQLAVVFMSVALGPIRWHYRQKINALVYQAIIE